MVEKFMTAEDALGASGDESFCLAVLWGRLTLRDEGAQDVQTASAWVVVPRDTALSWRTSGHRQTHSIPRASLIPSGVGPAASTA